jgi:hypothetical protein
VHWREREGGRLEDERFSNVQEWWNLFPRRVASKSIRRQIYILKKDERKKERNDFFLNPSRGGCVCVGGERERVE